MSIDVAKVISEIDLSQSIYKSCLDSLVSIYKDSEETRAVRISEIHDILEKWSEDNQNRNESDHVPFCEDTFNDLNHYEYHVDYLLMNSLFLSAFSMFENHLKRMTDVFSSTGEYVIKPNDIRGSGEIDTFRKYMNLVVNIDSASSDRHQWKDILSYKAIRNSVVHNSSILNKNKKPNLDKVVGYDLLEKYDIWFRGEHLYFRLRNIDFLIGFIETTTKFSNQILDEYRTVSKT
jgi:hypothetical protein